MGFWALAPIVLTLLIAFTSRSAIFALLAGCLLGAAMISQNPVTGFNQLLQLTLGNGDFIWICEVVMLIGILFTLFRRSGVIALLAKRMAKITGSERKVGFLTWFMGILIIDDYFSPLMTGAIMRPLTDQARISREKLAFVLDSTTSSVCILFPFAAWGAYITTLIAAQGGPVTSIKEALNVFIYAIPYNFYPILLIIFTLLVSIKVIPAFGPMKKAEQRVKETGVLLRPGSLPLMDTGSELLAAPSEGRASLFLHLFVPVFVTLGIAVTGVVLQGSVLIAEAFMGGIFCLSIAMFLQGQLKGITQWVAGVMDGIKDVVPALVVVALAYCLNGITQELGAANYLISITESWMTPSNLVFLTFLLAAFISFSTGTSWGTYALMIPLALPIAYELTGQTLDPLVYQVVAAIAGGGIFGDHASPLSDTSVLSSAGAGCDHPQLPAYYICSYNRS
jgi:Na+/H+ antiporter NhaC